ncbi:MAG: hypothetical protein HY548_02845 [Elusimicrobia bacterium]|nr:hypothetical protein [Elusimicrobiota bacterium]
MPFQLIGRDDKSMTDGSALLTPEQIDDLREVGNIGAGRASARLSEMIRQRCLINLPQIEYLNAQDIQSKFQSQDQNTVVLFTPVLGDIPARMFIFMNFTHAENLIERITKGEAKLTDPSTHRAAVFALKHLGDYMAWAFAMSISKFLKTSTLHAMPELIVDTWPKAMEFLSQHMESPTAKSLVTYLTFFDPEKTFEGKYLYILDDAAQTKVTAKLQRLWDLRSRFY